MTQAQFEFSAAGGVASLQIRGAAPGTTTYVDQNFVAAIGPDGQRGFQTSNQVNIPLSCGMSKP